MKLYVVKFAESVFGEDHIIRGGRSDVFLPIHFTVFFFDLGDRRILIDAGCDTMPGWDMRYFESPSVVLERAGVSCDSITDVIITHSHSDHIESVHYFKNAVIHIQEEEYKLGKHYIPEGFKVELFGEEKAFPEGITVKRISGHSIGSSIVEFPMGEKIGVISGDEVYHKSVLYQELPETFPPHARRHFEFLKKYRDEKYNIYVMHEPEFMNGRNGVELIYDSDTTL